MATSDITCTAIEIPLTKDYTGFLDVDDADLATLKWRAEIGGRNVYAIRTLNRKRVALHRIVLSRIVGRELDASECVDHINGNGCDNRRFNLRLSTVQENTRNQRRNIANTTGYKGVCWETKRQCWRAQIRVNGRRLTLGRFSTPEEAHEAYKRAALQYFGEFARFE